MCIGVVCGVSPSPRLPVSSRRLLEALNFAAVRHRHQRRKGKRGAPYVNHLIEVAHLLTTHGVEDDDVLVAAVLHDVVEDTSATPAEIAQRFGTRVAEIVAQVTDDDTLPLWERKQRQIETAPMLTPDAQHVRVADKISNLRGILSSPPEHWSLARKLAYYAWAEQVVLGCTAARPSLQSTFRDVHASGAAALALLKSSS